MFGVVKADNINCVLQMYTNYFSFQYHAVSHIFRPMYSPTNDILKVWGFWYGGLEPKLSATFSN